MAGPPLIFPPLPINEPGAPGSNVAPTLVPGTGLSQFESPQPITGVSPTPNPVPPDAYTIPGSNASVVNPALTPSYPGLENVTIEPYPQPPPSPAQPPAPIPPPPFIPTDIPGILWWLRADLGVTLNFVSEWADQSGAGDPNRNFVASVQRPTVIVSDPEFNNQAVINFDSSLVQELTMAGLFSSPITQPYTIIVVGKDDALLNTHRPWIGDANVNEWYMASFPNTSIGGTVPEFGSTTGVTGVSDVQLNSTTFDTGIPVIYMSEFNDNSSTIRINEDAAEPTQFWGTLGAPGKTAILSVGQLSLGWAFGTGNSLNGKIAELIVISGILSTAQRQGIETYLQARYTIPVAGLPGGITPILPSLLPGIELWVRADMGITASVSQWADQSGTGQPNAIQPIGASQPFHENSDPTFNNQASITFASSPHQFLTMAALWIGGAVPQPYTMFVVGRDSAIGSEVFLGQNVVNNWYVATTGGFYGASVGVTFVGTTPDSTTPKVLMIEVSDPSSTIRVSEETVEATGNGAFGGLPQLEISGADTGGGAPLAGAIPEIVLFNRILSNAERTKMFNYLGTRYAIVIGP